MKLWTLQPLEVALRLKAGQSHRADAALCARDGLAEDLAEAYAWMSAALARRVPAPPGVTLPVWAWHTRDPKHPGRPDLRSCRPTTTGALIEFDADPEEALLTDFDTWHIILNRCFLGDEPESEAFEAECARRGVPWGEWWAHEDLAERVRASWERLLDPDWWAPGWIGSPPGERQLQAVVWEIRPEQVRRVTPYRGWPPRAARVPRPEQASAFSGGADRT